MTMQVVETKKILVLKYKVPDALWKEFVEGFIQGVKEFGINDDSVIFPPYGVEELFLASEHGNESNLFEVLKEYNVSHIISIGDAEFGKKLYMLKKYLKVQAFDLEVIHTPFSLDNSIYSTFPSLGYSTFAQNFVKYIANEEFDNEEFFNGIKINIVNENSGWITGAASLVKYSSECNALQRIGKNPYLVYPTYSLGFLQSFVSDLLRVVKECGHATVCIARSVLVSLGFDSKTKSIQNGFIKLVRNEINKHSRGSDALEDIPIVVNEWNSLEDSFPKNLATIDREMAKIFGRYSASIATRLESGFIAFKAGLACIIPLKYLFTNGTSVSKSLFLIKDCVFKPDIENSLINLLELPVKLQLEHKGHFAIPTYYNSKLLEEGFIKASSC